MKYINKLTIENAEIETTNGEYTRNAAGITPFTNISNNTITLSYNGWTVFDTQVNNNTYIIDHSFSSIKKWSEENTNTLPLTGETITSEISTTAQIKAFWGLIK